MPDPQRDILKKYFGYDRFREGQEEAIGGVLSGRDVVAIMPTGAGKSLCFQIPALILPGVTLVISPLISLMKDQVTQLVQAGVPAAFLNSSLTEGQYRKALGYAEEGRYRIIYVAPERLESEGFLRFARRASVAMVAVDEAHCVSQWGQDFRPSYLKIPAFLEALSNRPVIGAFTATATERVRLDMERLLGLRDPVRVVTGYDRKNLYFEVRTPSSRRGELKGLVRKYAGQSGIVYCATRKSVEAVCQFLQKNGCPATRYHAGLSDEERRRNQEDFLYDRSPVMVATNAFGMGIDKSNVRFVIHFHMPKDVESYYQEAGRAGRDGEPADCILFFSPSDVLTGLYFIENDREDDALDPDAREAVRKRDRDRLAVMTAYCHTSHCLRRAILRYFGEEAPDACGNCGNCRQSYETADMTGDARRILACVRYGGPMGMGTLTDVLRGVRSPQVVRRRLDEEPGFGCMRGSGLADVTLRIRRLIELRALDIGGNRFPVIVPDPAAGDTLRREPVTVRIPAVPVPEKAGAAQAADNRLFERLRAVRAEIARARKVPAFMVFSDAALRDMARVAPRDETEMLSVSGVGQKKLDQYGTRFLEAVREFREQGID